MSIPNSDATTINSAFSMLLAAMARLLRSTSLAFCSSEYSGTVKNPLKKLMAKKSTTERATPFAKNAKSPRNRAIPNAPTSTNFSLMSPCDILSHTTESIPIPTENITKNRVIAVSFSCKYSLTKKAGAV